MRSISPAYRSLLPLNVEGLLVAGRSISQTHEGDMYTRGMYSCMILGQAAGTAGALAVRAGLEPRAVDRLALQQALVRQGVHLGQQHARVQATLGSVPVPMPGKASKERDQQR
ncbi:MAG: FAD-dependent oxidoreductase [Actinobacteria bacterium]|nr:FAD-dependent oxidoreductase [Actinomycetota bacterium]